jgi:hypothetical protein
VRRLPRGHSQQARHVPLQQLPLGGARLGLPPQRLGLLPGGARVVVGLPQRVRQRLHLLQRRLQLLTQLRGLGARLVRLAAGRRRRRSSVVARRLGLLGAPQLRRISLHQLCHPALANL